MQTYTCNEDLPANTEDRVVANPAIPPTGLLPLPAMRRRGTYAALGAVFVIAILAATMAPLPVAATAPTSLG
jgi:hypothetical protein